MYYIHICIYIYIYIYNLPSAKAPMVSIIKLTHNIITAFNGGSKPKTALIKVTVKATTLTVNWNCKNLRILSKTDLPHMTALTIDLKLSSRMTISEASLATNFIVIINVRVMN